MAELMMFQPGKAFMDSYNQAKAGSLAKIAFTEPQRRQSALADLYGLDPQAANSMKKEFDAQEQEQLKTFATAFVNAPDDNMRSQMYARAKEMWRPRFQALGSDIPDDWRQALPTIQALAGAGNQNTGVQSTFISGGKLHYLTRDGRPVNTGIEVDDSFQAITDPVTGQISGYGKRGNVLKPTTVGENGKQPPPQAGGEVIGNPVSVQTDNEAPVDFSTLPADEQKALALASQAAAQGKPFHYTVKGGVVAPSAPQQARVNVKPEAGITPYQEETLRLQREAAARAEAEAAARAAERKAAADAKAQERQARVESAQATTDNLLDNIRQLKKHPGFKDLGTLGGNAADSALPEFVPTPYRGAKARLETIKGQIALQAMAELKALSNTGATGFGALAVPELTLLQNSIQTLTTSQNNGDIMAALDQIEKLLTKAKSGAPAGGKGKYSVGQVLVINGKRYQVTGGDMNDPDLKELK